MKLGRSTELTNPLESFTRAIGQAQLKQKLSVHYVLANARSGVSLTGSTVLGVVMRSEMMSSDPSPADKQCWSRAVMAPEACIQCTDRVSESNNAGHAM